MDVATKNWQRHRVKGTGATCMESLLVVIANTDEMYHTATSKIKGLALATKAPPESSET
jgi:hypothetical protein